MQLGNVFCYNQITTTMPCQSSSGWAPGASAEDKRIHSGASLPPPQWRNLSRHLFKPARAAKPCTSPVSCYLWGKPEGRNKVPAQQLFPSKVLALLHQVNTPVASLLAFSRHREFN